MSTNAVKKKKPDMRLGSILNTMEHPYPSANSLPDYYKTAGKIIAFNIYSDNLERIGDTWGAIKSDAHVAMISHLIDSIHENKDTIHLKEVSDLPGGGGVKCFQDNNIPRYLFIIQNLPPAGEDAVEDTKGFRYWYIEIDDTMNIPENLRTSILTGYNRYTKFKKPYPEFIDSAQFERLKKARFGGSRTGEDQKVSNFVKNTLYHVTHNQELREFIKITPPEQIEEIGITDPNSPFNPFNALSPEFALDEKYSFNTGINPNYLGVEKYFNLNRGGGLIGSNLIGFPSSNTYRLYEKYITQAYFTCAKIPSVVRKSLLSIDREKTKLITSLDTVDKRIEDRQSLLDKVIEDARQSKRMEEKKGEIDQIREEITKLMDKKSELQKGIDTVEKTMESATDLPTGTNASFFISAIKADEEEFLNNEFRSLRRENLEKLRALQSRIPPNTPEYDKALQEHYRSALSEFMKVFKTSDKVSSVVFACRDFFKTYQEHQWPFWITPLEDMSPFANMMSRFQNEWEAISKCNTNHGLVFMLWITALTSGLAESCMTTNPNAKAQRNNMLLEGEQGAGKSFALDTVLGWLFKGSWINVAHFTAKAFTGKGNYGDLVYACHETPSSWLGEGDRGQKVPESTIMKTALAEGVINTIQPFINPETGERTMQLVRSTISANFMIATNTKVQPGPMKDRFTSPDVPHEKRNDRPVLSDFMQPTTEEIRVAETYTLRNQMIQAIVFTVLKAIESAAMPEINVDVGLEVLKIVFEHIDSRGIPIPKSRKQGMYKRNLCGIVVLYAVYTLFFTEMRLEMCDKETPGIINIDADMLYKIIPMLVANEEHGVFAVTLHESIFYPPSLARLVEILKRKAQADEITPITSFRYHVEEKAGKKTNEYDYQYISVRFQGKLFQLLDQLNEKHAIPTRALYTQFAELRNTKIESYKKDKDENEFHNTGKWKILDREEKTVIPAVVIESDPEMPATHSRICIAYDLVKNASGGVGKNFKSIIEEALEHKYREKNRKYITSYYFTKQNQQTKKSQVYFGILDTVEMRKHKTRVIQMESGSAIAGYQEELLYNHMITDLNPTSIALKKQQAPSQNKDGDEVYSILQTPLTRLDDELDNTRMMVYAIDSGCVTRPDMYLMMPELVMDMILQIRTNDPTLNEMFKNKWVKTYKKYPEEYVAEIDLFKKKKATKSNVDDPEIPGYTKTLPTYARNKIAEMKDARNKKLGITSGPAKRMAEIIDIVQNNDREEEPLQKKQKSQPKIPVPSEKHRPPVVMRSKYNPNEVAKSKTPITTAKKSDKPSSDNMWLMD